MSINNTVFFIDTPINIVDHDGKKWLTATEVGLCMGYNDANARQGINNLFKRHEDEFTEADTCVINLMTQGQMRQVRIFSDTGCIKLGFFASTARAKEFRAWAAKYLARPVAQATIPTTHSELLAVVQAMAAAQTQVLERVDRLVGVVEKLIGTLPAILSAQRPRVRRPPIFEKDLPMIFALRDQGATLPDIVRATGFGQTAVYYVLEGHYAVMPGGRVKKTPATDVVSAIVRSQGAAA